MIVALHGEPAGRTVARPLAGAAASLKDPATAVRYARRLMLNGIWRTVPKTGDDVTKAEYTLRVRTPAALAVLPRSAIAGLTRPAPPGGCHWCVATFHAATSDGVDPAPEPDAYTEAFLGPPGTRCGCRQRHRIAQKVAGARVRGPLVASADACRRRGMNSQDPALDRIVWRHRYRLTAAARPAPEPGYYRRRPRPWPRTQAGGRR